MWTETGPPAKDKKHGASKLYIAVVFQPAERQPLWNDRMVTLQCEGGVTSAIWHPLLEGPCGESALFKFAKKVYKRFILFIPY
jgi:hypothetical protein